MGSAKNKVSGRTNYITHEGYNNYITKYPDSKVTYTQYIAILKRSTVIIRDYILENSLGFKLPYNIGYISVTKFKTNKDFVAIDWINTRKLGKIIPLTNFHSFGHAFKIKLFKNNKMQPLLAYKMNAHRIIKRMLAQKIKSGKADHYINIDRNYFTKRFSIENTLNK